MATRRERVVLILNNDQFNPAMAKSAATTALLARELNALGKHNQRLSTNSVTAARSLDRQAQSTNRLGVAMVRADKNIDRLSGRLKIIVQTATALGPALAPIATSLVPVLTGLTTGLGFIAGAAGTAVVALNGTGEALKAMEAARLEPTVANLEAAAIAVERLGPDGAAFVKTLNDARPALRGLQMDARAGLLPGLGDSLDIILTRGDQVGRILYEIGDATGDLFREASQALASGDFTDFFDFIEREARPQLMKLGRTLGLVAAAGADVFMALDPLTDSFGDGLLNGARKLAEAAARMEDSEGVRDFIAYVQDTGPQVVDTFLSLGNAVLKIGEAAAPLGGPVLQAVEAFADAIAAIADSPIGTPLVTLAVGASVLARAVGVVVALQKAVTVVPGKMSAAGVATKALSNPLVGLAVAAGTAVVVMDKLGKQSGKFEASSYDLASTLDQETGAITANTVAYVANEFQKQGVSDAAKTLGVDFNTLTQAALGNEAAVALMDRQIAATQATFYDSEGRTIVGAKVLDNYRDATYKVGSAVGQTSNDLEKNAAAIRATADAAAEARGTTVEWENAVRDLANALSDVDEFLNRRASWRGYQAALDDFTAGLKENGNEFRANNAEGRANLENLDAITQQSVEFARSLKPTRRATFINNAIAELQALKAQSPAAAGEIDKLIAKLEKAGRINVEPKVTAKTEEAERKLAAFKKQLDMLKGDVATTYVDTVHRNVGAGGRGQVEVATGGYIRGPGTGTSDSIPARLSNGEYVINARATSLNRSLLEQINTSGKTRRFANGGAVGGSFSPLGAGQATDSLSRLARSGDRAAKSLDKATSRRDNLLSKSRDVRSTVTDAFRTDQFAAGSDNPWSESASSDPLAALNRDSANAIAFKAALARLRRSGLSGAAYEDIAARGDLAAAQQLGSQSRTYLAQYETAFDRRDRVTAGVGGFAADSAFGKQLAAANRQLSEIKRELKDTRRENRGNADRTGKAVGKEVNGAASRGTRDKARH